MGVGADINIQFITGTQKVAALGQRRTKCEPSVTFSQKREEVTGSEQGAEEFHPWFTTALGWFPWPSWPSKTPWGMKAAQLDPISRPCFHPSLPLTWHWQAHSPRLGKSRAPPHAESPSSRTREVTQQSRFCMSVQRSPTPGTGKKEVRLGQGRLVLCLALPPFLPM